MAKISAKKSRKKNLPNNETLTKRKIEIFHNEDRNEKKKSTVYHISEHE